MRLPDKQFHKQGQYGKRERISSLTNLLLTPWFQSFKLFHNPKEPMHDENKTLPLKRGANKKCFAFFHDQ